MRTALITAAAALLSTLPARAGELPSIAFLSMGFREATPADLAGSAHAANRLADPSGFLAASADFNGDGRPDEARLLVNAERQVAYVVVVTVSRDNLDTYVLKSLTLSDAANVGLALAPPRNDDPAARAGIVIFALDGSGGEASFFDGEEFSIRVPAPGPTPPAPAPP